MGEAKTLKFDKEISSSVLSEILTETSKGVGVDITRKTSLERGFDGNVTYAHEKYDVFCGDSRILEFSFGLTTDGFKNLPDRGYGFKKGLASYIGVLDNNDEFLEINSKADEFLNYLKETCSSKEISVKY